MDERNHIDYEQTIAYFHSLHDVRFKLLAFLPVISGTALAFIPQISNAPAEFGLAVVGAIVIIGLTIYDQRNTQMYDRMVRRAQFLEKQHNLPPIPFLSEKPTGGAFTDRPSRRYLFGIAPIIWHDLGLSLIYGVSFGSWSYLILGALKKLKSNAHLQTTTLIDFVLPGVIFLFYTVILICLALKNDAENKEFDEWLKSTTKQELMDLNL